MIATFPSDNWLHIVLSRKEVETLPNCTLLGMLSGKMRVSITMRDDATEDFLNAGGVTIEGRVDNPVWEDDGGRTE